MLGLLGGLNDEGVVDLDVEEPERDQPNGIGLVDPALADHIPQREGHTLGAECVGAMLRAR